MKDKLVRWPYVLIGCIVITFLGFIYIWSIFRGYFEEIFGWNNAQLSLNFTLHNIFSCTGAFCAGKVIEKVSSRKVAVAAAILIAVGLLFSSLIEYKSSLMILYAGYGGVASFGLGMTYIICVNVPPKWYPDRSGLISGLLLMFIGVGSFILSSVAQVLCEAVGVFWALRIFAVVIALVIIICSRWMVAPGTDVLLPQPKGKSVSEKESLNMRQVMVLPSFWIFFLWNVCLSSAGLSVINSASKIATVFGAAALMGMLVSILNSVGRLIFGELSDRFTGRKVMMVNNGLLLVGGLCMFAGAKVDSAVLVFAGLFCTGAAFGANLTLRVTVLAERYGPKYNAANFGLCNLCVIPASIVGPYVAGVIQDAQGGAYDGVFLLVTCLGAAAFVLNFLFNKVKR